MEVSNPFGTCVLKAKVSQIVKPGVVHAQHGFWFPEKDGEEPTLYEVWRSNINELIPHKHIGKLGFGAPFKCILCSVKKGSLSDFMPESELIAQGFDRPAFTDWKEGHNA